MNHDLQNVRVKLNQRGYCLAALSRHISAETGEDYSPILVRKALVAWAGRSSGYPRGKTLQILLRASALIGEPVSPVVRGIIEQSARHAARSLTSKGKEL
jgi:hypothetical protein